MRAIDDERYRSFLSEIRQRRLSPLDEAYLRARLLSANSDINLDEPPWRDAYYVVPLKRLGWEINSLQALKRARRTK